MPEYLTPGVYVEETSFRARSIEGVPTSTVGMAGLTHYGPVPYPAVRFPAAQPGGQPTSLPPMLVEPPLVTSFSEFDRAFAGMGDITPGTPNYAALSARAFFSNGGRRLYVSRVFPWARTDDGEIDPDQLDGCFARRDVGTATPPVAQWRARWPGEAGREIQVQVAFVRSKNVIVSRPDPQTNQPVPALTGVQPGSLVELAAQAPPDNTPPQTANLRVIVLDPQDGTLKLEGQNGQLEAVPDSQGFHIQLTVTFAMGASRNDVYTGLAIDPRHPRSVLRILQQVHPVDELSLAWLRITGADPPAAGLLAALLAPESQGYLTGGSNGTGEAAPRDFEGEEANPDDAGHPATGLNALATIDDIAIVIMPDAGSLEGDVARTAVDALIGHCERLRYRMAIVDPPPDQSISGIRQFRSQFDSTYAALYYPWLEILDPNARPDPGTPPPRIPLPPSGFVAGIYARSDIERGVHKAPANEVLLGLTRFQANVTFDRQAVLNPEGINALRFFEGRANRVWGARTMSSDPEWKYVNVRRLFIYLEHSIDKATQWAVFEPNNERLWASIRQTIEDFLRVVWRSGALMGTRAEEAFFVRCDRTTMSQNDLDNGRLICLIGVAPTYPAEFVIFRIGQWTADAERN